MISTNSFAQKVNDDRMPLDFIPYCSDKSEPIEKPFEMDWVQTDINVITEKINHVPEFSSSIEKLKKLLPDFIDGAKNAMNETYDLGYNLKSTLHTIPGGYGSYNVDVLYYKNSILKIRLSIVNHEEILEEYLVKKINLPFTCLNGLPAFELVNESNIKTYEKEYGKVFIQSNDNNTKRKDAINYFTNIYSGGEFKEPYYILFGLGSQTFDNLRYFIVNKDYEVLEDLLYSPSPTSRLFVARTLLYLKEKSSYLPSEKIEKRTNEILANSELIKSGIVSSWVNKFEYDYFDVVKDYEKLLKTE